VSQVGTGAGGGDASRPFLWLAYGAALNEGRGLFASDEKFGRWIEEFVNDKLSVTANLHERAAALWAGWVFVADCLSLLFVNSVKTSAH
jgi:hypothetical protein